jgi:hypothetical protein
MISSLRRTCLALATLTLAAAACGSPDDPRVGEEGRVRFVTGGGCSNSTTLAVGARASVELESSTEEALPGELGVTSADPAILTARMGAEPATIELGGVADGEAQIDLSSSGEVIDSIVFGVKPAAVVRHTSELAVFDGCALDVVVGDVFGDCGSDECRLIGHSFLDWRVEPDTIGAFVLDFEGTASFRMGGPGSGQVIGQERSRARDLVTQAISIIDRTRLTGLAARLTTLSSDPSATPAIIELPGAVARPEALVIRLDGVLDDGSRVAISPRDVAWRALGDELVVEVPSRSPGDVLSTTFITGGTGSTTLVANVAILEQEQTFALELTAP